MKTTAAPTQSLAGINESVMTEKIVTLFSVCEGGKKRPINVMDLDGDDSTAAEKPPLPPFTM